MKICHLTSVHPHNDVRVFLKECCSLAAAGYEVHLITPCTINETINQVHIHGIGENTDNRLKRIINAPRHVYKKALSLNCDIYHFHDPELLFVGLLLKAKGKKVIYDAHEDTSRQILSKYWIPKYLRKSISFIVEIIENTTVRYLDGVVTATPYIANRFSGKCKYVVNINNYPLVDEIIDEGVSWKEKERVVCYIGVISVTRGIVEMVQATEKADVKLLLGGMFTPRELLGEARKLSGWQNVDFKGFVNRKESKPILAQSVAGLLVSHPTPSSTYALATKIFQYMAAGIPVITSNRLISNKDVIEKSKCGISVNPFEPLEIANAIKWIIEHPQEAEQMGRNGRDAVEKIYNWDIEKEKLFDLYEKLLSAN